MPPAPLPRAEPPPQPEFQKVYVAVWSDGRIVWSRDLVMGGSPYFSGKVDRDKILEVYRVLDQETSATEHEYTSFTIPDGGHEEIVMRGADGEGITWTTSHAKREGAKVHHSSRGLSSLADYDPNAPLDDAEIKWRHFHRDYDKLRKEIMDLPPARPMKFNTVRLDKDGR